jgi:putative addiction module killer protein
LHGNEFRACELVAYKLQLEDSVEQKPKRLLIYENAIGKAPYAEWLDRFDTPEAVMIEVRVRRARLGNLGHWKSIGEGVCELKFDSGPGYRVYFGQIDSTVVVLLCGGDKKTQKKDISEAKKLWQDFKERYHGKKD